MKAMVFTQYGSPDVLQLKDIAKPTPKDDEILIRVRATSIGIGDIWARNFSALTPSKFSMPILFWLPARIAMGFNKPKRTILGSEYAGDVEAVGKNVTRFKAGDAVFGYRAMDFGANAEYLCVRADSIISLKPSGLSYEEAASIPGGSLTALNLLRKIGVQPGQKVLINGASGSIGSRAVQLAKHYGAEVTGVCSTAGVEMVKAIGADKVIDYTREDFTRGNEQYYDLILDVMGKGSFGRAKRVLKPNGCYAYVSFKMPQLLRALWTSMRGGKKVLCVLSGETPADLEIIKGLVESGEITPSIDRCYPLEQAADAHRYAENGRKRGSVVLSLA